MEESENLESKKVYYSPKKWVEHPNYFTYVETDPEEDSKGGVTFITIGVKQSKKCRITGSVVNKCINNFGDKLIVAKQIMGIYNENISEEMKARMTHGIDHEDDARNWYISTTGYQIKQSFFAVPKFDYRLGAEHDGFVCDQFGNELDGIIEIKCPVEMYKSIKKYELSKSSVPLVPSIQINSSGQMPFGYPHIPEGHYDQMQMEMQIFNKNWCDYIIYCIPENKVHLERVFKDDYHWKVMYEKIEIFINTKLNPLLKELGSNYPYNPKG